MAERPIRTFTLFKSQTIKAGTSGVSDPIDLRDFPDDTKFSVYYNIEKSGTSGTCGSTSITYQTGNYYADTYITPTGGTCGTIGDSGGSDLVSINPPLAPFMKVSVAVGTSGTAIATVLLHAK